MRFSLLLAAFAPVLSVYARNIPVQRDSAVNAATSAAASAFQQETSALPSQIGAATSAAASAIQQATSALPSEASAAISAVQQATSALPSEINAATSAAGSAFQQATSALPSVIGDATSALGGVIGDATGAAGAAASGAANAVNGLIGAGARTQASAVSLLVGVGMAAAIMLLLSHGSNLLHADDVALCRLPPHKPRPSLLSTDVSPESPQQSRSTRRRWRGHSITSSAIPRSPDAAGVFRSFPTLCCQPSSPLIPLRCSSPFPTPRTLVLIHFSTLDIHACCLSPDAARRFRRVPGSGRRSVKGNPEAKFYFRMRPVAEKSYVVCTVHFPSACQSRYVPPVAHPALYRCNPCAVPLLALHPMENRSHSSSAVLTASRLASWVYRFVKLS
ncbi:hypothetical protein B0H14DRAFT_3855195 [Mycena olivaceomarginata]|nr:hypothetical protein B0H14DRAFT_3855195 [Mycena olivaceomarginata]